MDYITSKEISLIWGISNRRVNTLCKDGRIIGAYKNGLMWMIPKTAKKPQDQRKKKKKLKNLDYQELDKCQLDYENKLDKNKKKNNGIYYTPYKLVDIIIKDLKPPKSSVILDPCCGMGSFLIGLLKKGYINVYGVDNDENTVKYLNTIIEYDKVINFDSINNSAEATLEKLGIQKAEYILGNPPYVHRGSIFGNLFIGSIIRSLDMLKDNGILCYIIPKNFLHVDTYNELRKSILKNFTIESIIDLGAFFKNVRGEQIVLTIKKSKPTLESTIIFKEIQNNEIIENAKISQFVFDDVIRIYNSEYELTIYEKLNSSYNNLEKYCQGYIGRGRSKNNDAINGKDIKKFGFKKTKVPETGNKIFIQNIYSSESGIIGSFAGELEAKETVTVITDSNPEICKYLVGILHSRLINYFLFKYCFNGSKLTSHTDRKYLSKIPVVIEDGREYIKLIDLVNKLEIEEYLSDNWYYLYEKLNSLVYKIYKLNEEEKEFIDKYMKRIQSTRWTKNE